LKLERKRQFATRIMVGLSLGGLCGVGVGFNWYPPVVGVAAAGAVGVFLCVNLLRLKAGTS
jgi:hypothetical protein